MAVAGKVAITLSTENGGAWSANVTYDRLVAVKHNNNLYISRKTVANVEPPNNEFWFLALEGFSGDDIEDIINGTTQVGNAQTLDGHGVEYFAPKTDLANYLPKNTVRLGEIGFDEENGLYIYIDNSAIKIPYGLAPQDLFLKSGGTINGTVEIESSEIVIDPLRVISNHNADNRVLIEFRKGAAVQGYLGFYGSNNPIFVNIATGASHTLLHEGNKPTGTYTGNGSATTRQIATNGLGNCVLIFRGANSFALLSQAGYIAFNGTSVVYGTDAYFSTGKIYISNTSEIFNASGVNYEYQVL